MFPSAMALLCLMAMRVLNALACHRLLLSLGSHVGLRWTTGALWVTSLGRYVPGRMVAGLSAAVMLTRRGVELSIALAALTQYTAVMLIVGVMVSTPLAMTPLMRKQAPGLWIASLVVCVGGVIALHPRVFAALCNFPLRRLKRWELIPPPAAGPYGAAVGCLVTRALFLGAAAWFAARSFSLVGVRDYPLILATVALATEVGFLAVFVPVGLGVQEGIFLLVLGPKLGPQAGLLALLFRTLQVSADVLAGAAGLVILHPRFAGTQRAVRVGAIPRREALRVTAPGEIASLPMPTLTAGPIPALLMGMPHKPDFFVVGAAKCGTTSLYEYLRKHPQVFMPAHKEPHYFARDFDIPPEWCIRDDHQYVRLFAGAESGNRIGEASVWYLYSQIAAQELHRFSPDARIIVMLRNPIDMMYSLHGQFLWNCNDDILDFEEALAAQEERGRGLRIPPEAHMPAALQYIQVASFSSQVRRYHEAFGAERVHVILFDDFVRDTAGEYESVLRFLEVDPNFIPDFKISNPAKPITPRLNRFFARRPALRQALHTVVPAPVVRKVNYALPHLVQTVARPPRIDPRLRARLAPRFAAEIESLEQLLGRNLASWKHC